MDKDVMSLKTNLLKQLQSEQKKWLEELNNKIAKMTPEEKLLYFVFEYRGLEKRKLEGKEPELASGELPLHIIYDKKFDTVRLYFGKTPARDIENLAGGKNLFFIVDEKYRVVGYELRNFSTTFKDGNKYSLPLERNGEGRIRLNYDKANDVLEITLSKNEPVRFEEHKDYYGIICSYDKNGTIVGYTLVLFSEFFEEKELRIPTLSIPI